MKSNKEETNKNRLKNKNKTLTGEGFREGEVEIPDSGSIERRLTVREFQFRFSCAQLYIYPF